MEPSRTNALALGIENHAYAWHTFKPDLETLMRKDYIILICLLLRAKTKAHADTKSQESLHIFLSG